MSAKRTENRVRHRRGRGAAVEPDAASNNAKKTRGKPFERGNRYGRGRPHGSRNAATLLLEKILAEDAEEIIRSVIARAKDSDMQAARMLLDRIYPPARSRAVAVELPPMATGADVLKAHDAVIAALGEGEVTLDEAERLIAIVESKARLIENLGLAAEIEEIKERLGLGDEK